MQPTNVAALSALVDSEAVGVGLLCGRATSPNVRATSARTDRSWLGTTGVIPLQRLILGGDAGAMVRSFVDKLQASVKLSPPAMSVPDIGLRYHGRWQSHCHRLRSFLPT
ncbi:MAG: hypothetical protein KatS3mg055_2849 [Chloroflexus sp.]|uniref:hypothetical protein n=1 Tax=Chloroflexus sp. TaxID=1904827 RepID=UPI0021DE2FDA|nr:hypothetical protein [Chloroflexus sp.]GIV90331.1 MAG: hypothetical protein KatS3mg055_2849 [Chloroflexus sp.]